MQSMGTCPAPRATGATELCGVPLKPRAKYCSKSCGARGTQSWTHKRGYGKTWTCRLCGEEHRRQNSPFCSADHKLKWERDEYVRQLRTGELVKGASRHTLVKLGLKKAECEWCGLTKWRGLPAPLQLDHINGRASDNRIENLRILCANCHSQTETYCGRNKGNGTRGSR